MESIKMINDVRFFKMLEFDNIEEKERINIKKNKKRFEK